MLKTRLYQALFVLAAVLGIFFNINKAEACHAIALVNPDQNYVAGGIEVTASSDSPTCGCDVYWLDIEVRCVGEPFDAAAFNPGYWGPLDTYPYFQSDQMNKPNCVVQEYPWTYIPFSNLCPGVTYQYRMRENHNGEVGPWTSTFNFTVNGTSDPLVADATASASPICDGDCTTLSASVTGGCSLSLSYAWDNGAGTGSSVSVCPSTTTTYTVTVTEDCSAMETTASVTVDVIPSPVAGTAAVSPTSICPDETVDLTLSGSAGTIEWQYSTDGGSSWSYLGATTATHTTGPISVNTCFRAEVTGCGGSVYSNDVCVTVYTPPTVSVNDVTICDGESATLTATPSSTGGTYLWDTGETTQSITVSPSDTTTFTVTYTLNGCPSDPPGTGTVTVKPVATVTLNDDEVCILENDTAILTASPSITGGDYIWDTGATTQSIEVSPTVDTEYFITYTLNGCVSPPISGMVYITEELDATITPVGPFCPYDSPVTLTAVSSGGSWSGTGITDATNGTFDPAVAGSGLHTISYVIPDPCGDSAATDIEVLPLPVPSFTNSAACEDGVMDFTNTSTISSGSISSYSWEFDDGGTSTQTDPSHTFATAGVHNVELFATSAEGCSDSSTQSLTVDAIPVADFSATSVCPGNPTDFTDLSSVNNANITAWSWDFGDSQTSTLQNPTHTYAGSGTYNVQLTVTSDAPGACTHDTIIPVTVYDNPVADFTVNSVVCDGQSMGFTDNSTSTSGTVTAWAWDINNDGSVEYTIQNPSHTFPTSGTYPVNLEVTSSLGCIHDTVIQVTVEPLPAPSFTNGNACEGSQMLFTNTSTIGSGSITSYDWKFGDGGTSTLTNPAYPYPVSGTYNVTLTATSDQGCIDSTTQSVTVDDVPVASFSATTECIGNTTTFTDLSTVNNASIASWTWFFGDGQSSTQQSPTHLYNNPGVYNVQLIVTSNSPSGCVDDTTIQVTVFDDPVANFSANDACLNEPTQFTDLSTPSGAVVSWKWDFNNDGTLDHILKNPSFTYSAPGTYSVNLQVAIGAGCNHDTTIDVTVNPLPQAAFASDIVCANSATSLTDQSAGGGTINQWGWDIGNDGSTEYSTQNATNTWTTGGTYDVELHVTTSDGCVDSIVNQVVVNPEPVADFTATKVCLNNVTNFTDNSTLSTGNIMNWDWDFGYGNTSTQQNPAHTFSNSGTHYVTLTVTTDSNCTNTIQKQVIVDPLPTASFTVNDVCEYDSASFTNTTNGNGGTGLTYAWNFGDMGTSTLTNPNHLYATEGTYTVQLTATSSDGCTDQTSNQITIFDEPQAQFANTNECEYDTLEFTDNSSTTSILSNWNWDFGDGGTSTLQHPEHEYNGEGIYNVQLVVTTAEGCSDTINNSQVEVYPQPVADFIPTDVCLNTASVFSDQSQVSTLVFPNEQIQNNQQWNFGDVNTNGGGTGSGPSPSFTYTDFGTFNASILITTNHGCQDSITKAVTVHPNPVVNFAGIDTTGCTPVNAEFINSSTIQQQPGSYTLQYKWDFGDGRISTEEHPFISYDNESNTGVNIYDIKLTVTSNQGCVTSKTAYGMIEVYPIPYADYTFQPQPTSIMDPNIFFTDKSVGANQWTWHFGDFYQDSIRNPNHVYQDTGTYLTTQIVENRYGCIDSISKWLTINPEFALYIPNAFTPDKDGINETFFVKGIGVKKLQLFIFNRWGEKIYEGQNLEDATWDGTYQGSEVEQGVYLYKVLVTDVFNEFHEYQGSVTLLR